MDWIILLALLAPVLSLTEKLVTSAVKIEESIKEAHPILAGNYKGASSPLVLSVTYTDKLNQTNLRIKRYVKDVIPFLADDYQGPVPYFNSFTRPTPSRGGGNVLTSQQFQRPNQVTNLPTQGGFNFNGQQLNQGTRNPTFSQVITQQPQTVSPQFVTQNGLTIQTIQGQQIGGQSRPQVIQITRRPPVQNFDNINIQQRPATGNNFGFGNQQPAISSKQPFFFNK